MARNEKEPWWKMRDVICTDTESMKLASEVPGGWNSIHLMGFACGVIYSARDDSYMIYDTSDLEDYKQRLLRADEVITFNGSRFDYTLAWGLLNRQMPKELVLKSNDLYSRICCAANKNPAYGHKGYGLGAVCERTFGQGKIEDGANAPQLFRDGRFARLHSYCISDTRLTWTLAKFISDNGYVVGPKNVRVEVPAWPVGTKSSLPPQAGLTSQL